MPNKQTLHSRKKPVKKKKRKEKRLYATAIILGIIALALFIYAYYPRTLLKSKESEQAYVKEPHTPNLVYDDKYTFPDCNFDAPEGKRFYKWKYNGNLYNPGDTITGNDLIKIEAVWEDVN